MNIGWNVETFFLITGTVLSTIGSIFIMKNNWKQYGILYISSGVVGELLCYFFIITGLYVYPYRILPQISQMPLTLIMTMFPFYVMFGVRYSPARWAYKIPFYWVLVHIGMFGEVIAQNFTRVIKYNRFWDTWDSYTWWWLFLLIFEVIGGILVSKEYRKPIDEGVFTYGKLGWFIVHFILISTVFLAGFFMGMKTLK
ncbi:CBO0543 family protein [Clostridium felsineum]|uniref:Uncharacterized protein n=1 Tax=Clostridium felsineum TaxID=36839 RepID=A0A1S8KZ24_9CLOT|nr:CBO0543 family protein [Clostridium felsineum]MCR3761567.1 hypothetical protein [Clostridium felsineum]URZ04050.1 hypothetical protein CLAUR_041160 [Clostridium felsineum]URZ07700.1 hypothetical protein CLROS_030610 [Clostridium felsineum]URZ12731.1 hypothetical protein CROST_034760 [Clostridium felsineum]URZ15360.1 hypothetical protein CLFE_013780 [Clostridium felsineum DSM 794]